MYAGHGRLVEYPCNSWDDLPKLPDPPKGAVKEPIAADEMERRVLEDAEQLPDVITAKSGFRKHIKGDHGAKDAAVERLIARRLLIRGPKKGFIRAPSQEPPAEPELTPEQLSLLDRQFRQDGDE